MKRVTILFILLATVFAIPSLLAQNEPIRIGAGDTLGITLVGDKDISGQYKVDDNGYIKMPLLGSIKVAGETEEGLTKKLTEMLKKYDVDPVVTVVILERFPRYVTVTGAVRKGGKVLLRETCLEPNDQIVVAERPREQFNLGTALSMLSAIASLAWLLRRR
jgi:protein involved in polysaccharide export with SLBB domain